MQKKTFKLEIELQTANTPHKWNFENCSGLEMLAVWTIIKALAETQINELLNLKP